MTQTGLHALGDGFFYVLVIPSFGFVSDFEFRASNL